MAILKATILSAVNARTRRAETDIDAELIRVLKDLSQRGALLQAEATGTLAAEAVSFAAPAGCKGVVTLHFDDDAPEDEITWQDYRRGALNGYVLSNGTIYVYPAGSAARAYTLNYWYEHAANADAIAFDDRCEEAIIEGVCAKILRKYRQTDAESDARARYEDEITKLLGAGTVPYEGGAYHDMY